MGLQGIMRCTCSSTSPERLNLPSGNAFHLGENYLQSSLSWFQTEIKSNQNPMNTSLKYSITATWYGAKQEQSHILNKCGDLLVAAKGLAEKQCGQMQSRHAIMNWQGAAAKPIKWYEPDNKWFSLHDLKKPTASKFNHVTMQWL